MTINPKQFKVNEPGIASFTLDGVDCFPPKSLTPNNPLRQALFQGMSGRVTVDRAWDGSGLPDVLDAPQLELPYETDDTNGSWTETLETLRTSGGAHELAWWKQHVYTYTLAPGQAVIYLPRVDAFTKGYAGATDQATFGAVVTLSGSGVTVVYKPSVTSATSVTAGEIWISNASTSHPDTGATVTLAKLGTPPVGSATLVVKFYPLFRVVVAEVRTTFDQVGREDKVLVLAETN